MSHEMDFELNNFWIHKLGFNIKHKSTNETFYLYVSLKTNKEDLLKAIKY